MDKLKELKRAYEDNDEDKINEIMEHLEDKHHVDLTHYYGADIKQIEKKLKKLTGF